MSLSGLRPATARTCFVFDVKSYKVMIFRLAVEDDSSQLGVAHVLDDDVKLSLQKNGTPVNSVGCPAMLRAACGHAAAPGASVRCGWLPRCANPGSGPHLRRHTAPGRLEVLIHGMLPSRFKFIPWRKSVAGLTPDPAITRSAGIFSPLSSRLSGLGRRPQRRPTRAPMTEFHPVGLHGPFAGPGRFPGPGCDRWERLPGPPR